MSDAGHKKVKVLLIEDESLVAMLIEDLLTEQGYEIAATAGRLDDALQCARALDFDIAIVDLNLGGQRTDAVPPILQERGIGFLFATGYGSAGVTDDWKHIPVLQKPFQPQDLAAALARVSPRA